MKIVVLGGGLSPERNVSLSSSYLICKALREKGHQAVLVDLFLGVEKIEDTVAFFSTYEFERTEYNQVDEIERTIEEIKSLRQGTSQSLFGPNVLALCQAADMVFLGLHGEDGENGKVQATFETLAIPYTGTDSFSSALAMDKKITKIILDYEGVKTPEYLTVRSQQEWEECKKVVSSYPVVVKPSSGGSSIGVTIAQNPEEADTGVLAALRYDTDVVIEAYIKGREFSVGFLGDKILPPIEIIPKVGFYDYKNKYQIGMAEEICPAELTENQTLKLQDLTEQVKEILGLKVYGRVDFLLNSQGDFYCIEANSLPGMTPTSLLPMEARAANISYEELCEQVIKLSITEKD